MKRIQRKRTKGWRMPENTLYVGRPTRWGNPYKAGERGPYLVGYEMTAEDAVELFEDRMKSLKRSGHLEELIAPLRGKDLACWCPLDHPCHADVLLELANKEPK